MRRREFLAGMAAGPNASINNTAALFSGVTPSDHSSSRAAAEQGFVVVVGGGFDDGGEPLDPPHADTSSPSAADARRRFTARYFLI